MQIGLLGRESCEQLLALRVDAEVEAVGEARARCSSASHRKTAHPADPGLYPRNLKAFGLAEGADDGGRVLVLGVDGVVETADVGGGEFAGEIGEGSAELGESG
jgi:hypothetical protein